MRTLISIILAALTASLIISCSGTPTAPGENPANGAREISGPSGQSLWGIWDVYIDPDTSTADVVPIRGASFECNVVNFLQPPSAPIHMLTIQIDPGDTNFPAGKVACDVTIKHPFPGTKFCGFDVLGIVMGSWENQPLSSDPDIIASLPPNTILQNPDGYTRWWNMPEFTTYGTLLGYIEGARAVPGWNCTSTLNGFKYFCDGLGAFDAFNPDPTIRGFFSSVDPGINKRRYELQFPAMGGVQFKFKYAVSASWVAPYDGTQPPYQPDEFPLTANMAEAYKIGFNNTVSTAYYVSESIYGGDINGYIEVRDWQIGGALPSIPNEIASVTVESPTLFPDPIDVDISGAFFAPGNINAVWIPVSIEDVTPTAIENQLLIITVKSGNITDYAPQIPGITGFDYPDADLAAYNIIRASIKNHAPQQIPPVADTGASNPVVGENILTVHLDPSLSHDLDGFIVQYEWDFTSDGSWDVTTGTPDVIDYVYYVGNHTATLRVTDNDMLTDTDPLHINVTSTADTSWLQHRSDFSRDGRTSVVGPATNTIKFTYQVTDGSNPGIIGGIAVDHQGRALFRSNSGYLYCVNTDGSLAWKYAIAGGSQCHSCPSIGPDDSVYIGNEESEIFHVDSNGNEIWTHDYGHGQMDGGFILQDDGTLIFTTEGDYCIKADPDGNEIWSYYAGATIFGGPAMGPDDTIYFTNTSCQVFALAQGGNMLWVTDVGGSYMNAAPAVGPNGIFIGNQSSHFFCLNFDGSIKWDTPVSDDVTNVAAVGDNGQVYFGTSDGFINCLDQETGEILWQYQTTGKIGLGSIILDGGGHVYVGNYEGDIFCVTTDGDLVWSYDTGDSDFASKSPAISQDGTLLIANTNGTLFAFHD